MQSLLRQAEEAARWEALAQIDALKGEATAAVEEKGAADAALEETRRHLDAAWAQVRPHAPAYTPTKESQYAEMVAGRATGCLDHA